MLGHGIALQHTTLGQGVWNHRHCFIVAGRRIAPHRQGGAWRHVRSLCLRPYRTPHATAMTPGLRKFGLTAHVTCSVGLLGAIAAFLVLAVLGLTSKDDLMVRAAYPAMQAIARFVIVPLAFAALLSGLIQSLGTPWGVFRHYWILVKLLLTIFAMIVLLVKMELIGYAARLAAETTLAPGDLRAVGIQLVVHAAGGLLVLLVPMVLSMYKPPGMTLYGWRKQHKQRALSRP